MFCSKARLEHYDLANSPFVSGRLRMGCNKQRRMYGLYSGYNDGDCSAGGLVCGALASGHHVKSSDRNRKQLEYLTAQHENPAQMYRRMIKCRDDAGCVYPYWSLFRQIWMKPLERDRHSMYQDMLQAMLDGTWSLYSSYSVTFPQGRNFGLFRPAR